jgi:2'-5' RNA ligase
MRTLQGYRYLLCIKPNPQSYPAFQRIAAEFGHPIHLGQLHLTLCVVGETTERDHFILRRLQRAFHGQALHSFSVNLSRVDSGPNGAFARTSGHQAEIQDFYRMLRCLLLACGIAPKHRKSGLHPHVTLFYRGCPIGRLPIALSWFPTELLLIESEVGLTQHNLLGRWPLSPPRQPWLPFDDVCSSDIARCITAAANRGRRSCA